MRTAELKHQSAAAIAKSRAVINWTDAAVQLDAHGCAIVGPLLSPKECRAISDLYGADEPFRSRIVMARHGFGSGEYKYFAYPLPSMIAEFARDALSRAGPNRQPLECADGHWRAVSGDA